MASSQQKQKKKKQLKPMWQSHSTKLVNPSACLTKKATKKTCGQSTKGMPKKANPITIKVQCKKGVIEYSIIPFQPNTSKNCINKALPQNFCFFTRAKTFSQWKLVQIHREYLRLCEDPKQPIPQRLRCQIMQRKNLRSGFRI